MGVQSVDNIFVGQHPRVGFLGRLDFSHQELAEPSFANVLQLRRCSKPSDLREQGK